ncbi:MAG: hypothetical protein AB4426_23305 [Xenococcaceae cyanobacterium]
MSAYDISPFPTQTREELEGEVAQAQRILEKYKKRSLFRTLRLSANWQRWDIKSG